MANWNTLKTAVADIINANGNQAITGQLLQNVLNNIITNVGENATFIDVATLDTNPGAPDGPVFYLATTAGIYSNFNGIELLDGEAAILLWDNNTWSKKDTGLATKEKLSELGSSVLNWTDGYVVFDNDKKLFYSSTGSIGRLVNGKVVVTEFSEIKYGKLSAETGNVVLVLSSEILSFKQINEVQDSDVIIAALRVRWGLEYSEGYEFEIDHITYINLRYVIVEGGRIVEYNTKKELNAIAAYAINNRNVDFLKMKEYENIFGDDLVVYEMGSHYRLTVAPGLCVKIKANVDFPTRYVFMESDSTMIPCENATRIDVAANTECEVLIPDGCYCLYINKIDGAGNDLTPSNVVVKNSMDANFTIANAYSLGELTFNNIDKTISIVGDVGVTIVDAYGNTKTLDVNTSYGELSGESGYGVLALSLDGNSFVCDNKTIPNNSYVLAIFRVKFEKSNESGYYKYDVDYIYQSKMKCNVIHKPLFLSNSTIPYEGNKLCIKPTLMLNTYGSEIFQSYIDGCAAQGMAIYNGYMFQLRNTGLVSVYDITKKEPILKAHFSLGSSKNDNHANSAQFGNVVCNDTGFPYLYVGSCVPSLREMYVEKISLEGSELVQTITFDENIASIPNTNTLNCIAGDDNYIWVNNHLGNKLYFTKLRLPNINEGDVILTGSDVVDYWSVDYDYNSEVRQDISVYNGKFFFQYGGSSGRKGIKVYDTVTHQLLNVIDLTKYVSEEFEGMDIYNSKIWITLLANKGYILHL